MSQSAARASVGEALLMSVLLGLAATFCGAVLVACFYFFDPVARGVILRNPSGLLIVAVVVFVMGFAATLESILWTGFWGTDDRER
jgi:H+/Cl- antiporter ClcA